MQKIIITVSICLLGLLTMQAQQNRAYELYKNIPKYNSINFYYSPTTSDENWRVLYTLTIDDKYNVVFEGKDITHYDKETKDGYNTDHNREMLDSKIITYATGFCFWDNNTIKINLSGTIAYAYSKKNTWNDLTEEMKRNKGKVTNNVMSYIFGGKLEDAKEYYTVRTPNSSTRSGSANKSFSNKIISISSTGQMSGESEKLPVTLYYGSGSSDNITVEVPFNYDYNYTVKEKSMETLQNEAIDEYGAWQWTDDKKTIYLESQSKQNYLSIAKIGDGAFTLGIVSPKNTDINSHITLAKGKDSILNLSLWFDNEAPKATTFLVTKQNGATYFYYTLYDRFSDELNIAPNQFLKNNFIGKSILHYTYSIKGQAYHDMFRLEGLNNILKRLGIVENN